MDADITLTETPINATFKLEIVPDISGLATKAEVAAVEAEIPDVTGFATKTELSAVENQIPDISGLATKTEVAAVENEIPDITGLATKTELSAVEAQIPTVPTNVSAFTNDSNYVTETVLSQKLLVSNALTTGNVSDNAVVFADILSKLHSSFDLSKFTVVGNPTVTSDGIVSNTGVLKGCLINCPEIINNSFNISYDIKFQGAVSGSAYVMTAENSQFGLFLDGYALRVELKTSLSGQDIIIYETVLILVTAHSYNINLSFNASSLEFKVKATDKTTLANSGEKTYTLNRLFASSYVKLYGEWSKSPNITYDLKPFSVKVNGVEVFSGNKTGVDSYTIDGNTVTIPYTITKGGAKIADVASRPDVQSVYTANGFAPYYTIDTENQNFTLPMGDLYGMLQKLSDRISALES